MFKRFYFFYAIAFVLFFSGSGFSAESPSHGQGINEEKDRVVSLSPEESRRDIGKFFKSITKKLNQLGSNRSRISTKLNEKELELLSFSKNQIAKNPVGVSMVKSIMVYARKMMSKNFSNRKLAYLDGARSLISVTKAGSQKELSEVKKRCMDLFKAHQHLIKTKKVKRGKSLSSEDMDKIESEIRKEIGLHPKAESFFLFLTEGLKN